MRTFLAIIATILIGAANAVAAGSLDSLLASRIKANPLRLTLVSIDPPSATPSFISADEAEGPASGIQARLVSPEPDKGIQGTRADSPSVRNLAGTPPLFVGATDRSRIAPAFLPYYTTSQGISFSTPQVSGIIALMLEADSLPTPDQTVTLPERTTTPKPCQKRIAGSGHVAERNAPWQSTITHPSKLFLSNDPNPSRQAERVDEQARATELHLRAAQFRYEPAGLLLNSDSGAGSGFGTAVGGSDPTPTPTLAPPPTVSPTPEATPTATPTLVPTPTPVEGGNCSNELRGEIYTGINRGTQSIVSTTSETRRPTHDAQINRKQGNQQVVFELLGPGRNLNATASQKIAFDGLTTGTSRYRVRGNITEAVDFTIKSGQGG